MSYLEDGLVGVVRVGQLIGNVVGDRHDDSLRSRRCRRLCWGGGHHWTGVE